MKKSKISDYRNIDQNGVVTYDLDGVIESFLTGEYNKEVLLSNNKITDEFNKNLKFNSLNDEYKKNKLKEYKFDDSGEFDKNHQIWIIPEEYLVMDIETYIIELADTMEELDRIKQELEIFKKHDYLNVLRAMKYISDTLISKDITYGVGRGSSVASYILFKLKIHRIDCLKYQIPFEEFLE